MGKHLSNLSAREGPFAYCWKGSQFRASSQGLDDKRVLVYCPDLGIKALKLAAYAREV